MKRALMAASVASMIVQFNMPNIKLLQDMGYTVEVACNFGSESSISEAEVAAFRKRLEAQGVRVWDLDCPRSVTAVPAMVRTYRQLRRLAKERNYALVHTQSPIGGVLTRLAFRSARRRGTKVIYEAHGFHFYEGAPKKNWMIYYPIEKFCARFTDVLITINKEDYARAREKFAAKRVMYVPGIGLDIAHFAQTRNMGAEKRRELGIDDDTTVLLSVGELNENKNHRTVIEALGRLKKEKTLYLICGRGGKQAELEELIRRLDLREQVKILGFRTDISEIYRAADCFVFPSYREGLSVALMEAMASGLPCVVSRIRGNVDLLDEESGVLVPPGDVDAWALALAPVSRSTHWGEAFARQSEIRIQDFSRQAVQERMTAIYESCS